MSVNQDDKLSVCAVKGCKNNKHKKNIPFHRFPSNMHTTVKWAFFCQNPAFEGVNAEDIAAKVSRHRYVICSEHFVPTDYRDGKEGSSRNLNTGAVPTIYGSLFEDTLGDVISPIQPPKNKFQARLSGLLPNHSDSDSDNEFENMDYEEFCSKIENRFEERGENFTPPTLNLEQNHLSTKTNTPEISFCQGESSDSNLTSESDEPRNAPKKQRQRLKPTAKDLGSFDKSAIFNKAFYKHKYPRRKSKKKIGGKKDDKTDGGRKTDSEGEKTDGGRKTDSEGEKTDSEGEKPDSEKIKKGKNKKKKAKKKRLPGREERLTYELYALRRDKQRLTEAVRRAKTREIKPKQQQEIALNYIRRVLEPAQAEFLCSVVTNAKKKPRGRRYNKETKAISLSLYLFDPRAYNNLRLLLKAIPSRSLLQEMLEKNPVEEGFLPFVFEALKFVTGPFDERSKYVSLSWDGINLKQGFHYVRKVEDDGGENGFIGGLDGNSKEPASEAVVLMVRSIYGDFKQPLAYFNFDPHLKAEKLEPIINTAIEELQKTGLVVKALVCDQASEHQALYKNLFQVTPEKPFIVRNGCKIYCLFDPPHLLKNVKANLKRRVASVDDEEVSWADIVEFYELDILNVARIAPKLKHNHIYGDKVTNMSVPMAAQVLSRTVAGGIREYVAQNLLAPTALKTAECCELFNDLFDSFNSSLGKDNEEQPGPDDFPSFGIRDYVPPDPEERPSTRSPLREPLSQGSLHMEIWKKAEKYIKDMQYFYPTTGQFKRPPSLNGWLLTISAVRMLWIEFQELGYKTMPTKTLNQDFVENFFSQVRQRNGHPDVTCREFRNVFKFLLHSHIIDPSRGRNTNCSVDGGKFLFLIQDVIYSRLLPPETLAENFQEPGKKKTQEAALENPAVNSRDEVDESDRQLVAITETDEDYILENHPGDVKFSSYLARRIILNVNQCASCKALFTSEEKLPQHRILENTENKASSYKLYASSSQMQVMVHNCLMAFDSVLMENYGDRNLGRLISNAIQGCDGFSLLSKCPHHKGNPSFFLKVFIKAEMRYRIKLQNTDLAQYIKNAREKVKVATLAASSRLFGRPIKDSKKKAEPEQEKKKQPQIDEELKQARKKYFEASKRLNKVWNKQPSQVHRGLFVAVARDRQPCQTSSDDVDIDGILPISPQKLGENDSGFATALDLVPDFSSLDTPSGSNPMAKKRLSELDPTFKYPLGIAASTPKRRNSIRCTDGPSSLSPSTSSGQLSCIQTDSFNSSLNTPRTRLTNVTPASGSLWSPSSAARPRSATICTTAGSQSPSSTLKRSAIPPPSPIRLPKVQRPRTQSLNGSFPSLSVISTDGPSSLSPSTSSGQLSCIQTDSFNSSLNTPRTRLTNVTPASGSLWSPSSDARPRSATICTTAGSQSPSSTLKRSAIPPPSPIRLPQVQRPRTQSFSGSFPSLSVRSSVASRNTLASLAEPVRLGAALSSPHILIPTDKNAQSVKQKSVYFVKSDPRQK